LVFVDIASELCTNTLISDVALAYSTELTHRHQIDPSTLQLWKVGEWR